MKFSLVASSLIIYFSAQAANAASCMMYGTPIKSIDYNVDNQSGLFNYSSGWAGSGFGLSGTQRGAPEKIFIEKSSTGNSLRLSSLRRTEAWYALNPGASKHPVYAQQDSETQDDLFLYSSHWTPANRPYFYGSFHTGPGSERASLRIPIIYNGSTKAWPGIWHGNTNYYIRTVGGKDYWFSVPEEFRNTGDVTLGMSTLIDGDLKFYIKYGRHTKEALYSSPDKTYLNSVLVGHNKNKITSQNDATIMLSQVMPEDNPQAYNKIYILEYGQNFECN